MELQQVLPWGLDGIRQGIRRSKYIRVSNAGLVGGKNVESAVSGLKAGGNSRRWRL